MTIQDPAGSRRLEIPPRRLNELRGRLQGRIIRPADEEYRSARHVWNGMIDRYPALIVQVVSTDDVATAIAFGRANGMAVAIRGGGHGVAGHAVCDNGIVVDLSAMSAVTVNADARTARVEGGARWRALDGATSAFGLTTTGGLVSTTGVAGLTLGGGIGWLMRKHGLACDNVRRVDLVTAAGRTITADADHEPELFWALRGGGGNFGAVTAFEYALHPVETVFGGMVLHAAERAPEVLAFWDSFVEDSPDELTTMAAFLMAPHAPFVPDRLQGRAAVAIVGCFAGDPVLGERATEPLRRFGPPQADLFGPMPYVVLQSMLDAGAPAGMRAYWKSGYLRQLGASQIETIASHASTVVSPLTQVHLHHLGGAVARVAPDATAFGHRDARYVLNIAAGWSESHDDRANVRWTRDFWSAIRPDTDGAYVNFLGADDERRLGDAYDSATLARLRAVKAIWDPENVFRPNLNISPSAG